MVDYSIYKLEKLLLYFLPILLLLSGSLYGKSLYLGSKNCAKCHQQIYDKWKKTAHGKKQSKLTSQQLAHSKCSGCHMPVKGEKQIGCEGCHGSGIDYAQSFIMKDPILRERLGLKKTSPKTCERCHNRYAYRHKRVQYDQKRFEVCGYGKGGKKADQQSTSPADRAVLTPKPSSKKESTSQKSRKEIY